MNKINFPIFNNSSFKGHELIYLDNASTTQKSVQTINHNNDFYLQFNSNIGRSQYHLADEAEACILKARKTIARFINTDPEKIVFTNGCTDSLNLTAHILKQILAPNTKIVLSIAEHHANILPWQNLAKELNLTLDFIKDPNVLANPSLYNWDNVSLVCLTQVSNVTGQIHPIYEWTQQAHKHNALICIDGAQGICSQIVDLNHINCDFYAFSAHKLYGPTGLGVLVINKKLEDIIPYRLGGGIVEDVYEDNYSLISGNQVFEAGTLNLSAINTFQYTLNELIPDWKDNLNHVNNLYNYMILELEKLDFIKIIKLSKNNELNHTHICSFQLNNIHPHDVGTFLARKNIAIRTGHHCAKPLHRYLGIQSSIRASLAGYNDYNDIDLLILNLTKCNNYFNK